MNRKISWLLCLVLVFTLLAGCGRTASPEPSEEPLAVAISMEFSSTSSGVMTTFLGMLGAELLVAASYSS